MSEFPDSEPEVNNPLPDVTLPLSKPVANCAVPRRILIEVDTSRAGLHVEWQAAYKDADGKIEWRAERGRYDDDDITRLGDAFLPMQPQIAALMQGLFDLTAAIYQAKQVL